jgi:hypothetical protein
MANGASVQIDGGGNIGNMKKFNETNFQIWKFQVTTIFHVKKLLGIVARIETLEVAMIKKK